MINQPRCHERGCIHFVGAKGKKEIDQVVVCTAFPDGIPDDIAYGDNLHLEPVDGDNGIQFEEEASEG